MNEPYGAQGQASWRVAALTMLSHNVLVVLLMCSCAHGYIVGLFDASLEIFTGSICSNSTPLTLTLLGRTGHELREWTTSPMTALLKKRRLVS